MILVTATGTLGKEVVAQLVEAGESVRAMTRNPARIHASSRLQVIQGDLNDPESLKAAVDSVDRIFSLALGPEIGVQEARLAQEAKSAGVQHVVKLSVLGAGGTETNGVLGWHNAGERAFQNSSLKWTFVRPGVFMSNARFWQKDIAEHGKVWSIFGDGKVAAIHPKDIASVVVCALTTLGHDGKAYPLTGGEALSLPEQVGILARVLARSIDVVPCTDEDARIAMGGRNARVFNRCASALCGGDTCRWSRECAAYRRGNHWEEAAHIP